MASNIDNTVPSTDAALLSEPIRNNFIVIKSEINALQNVAVTNGDSHDHTGGAGAQIAYANLSGLPSLGKILQVVQATTTTLVALDTTTYTSLGLSVAITPRDTNSKILLMASLPVTVTKKSEGGVGYYSAYTRLKRGSTAIADKVYLPLTTATQLIADSVYVLVDSPASAAEVVYSFEGRCQDANTIVAYFDSDCPGTLVAMEIAG